MVYGYVPTMSVSARSPGWIAAVGDALRCVGHAVVEDVIPPAFLDQTRDAMSRAQRAFVHDLGSARLARAGEYGAVVRNMFAYDPHFFRLLEIPELLAVVDATVSATAILHLQNGLILAPAATTETTDVEPPRFHRDFPRVLNGYVASINVLVPIDPFTRQNGATLVAPGSHQRPTAPTEAELRAAAVAVACTPGAMLVFDSTLWHAAGVNRSGRPRLAINHQFTRSYIKPQIDYVRALGETTILGQTPRTQQLLGWFTRVPASLDEYYRPEHDRVYRKDQG
jgi:ectoine hydroxylase-related dioxygenase (phytanoyl-CoA dioxygenase family)